MYIHTIPNRNSPPAILLRESYREKGKVKNRTLANLSSLPPQSIEILNVSDADEDDLYDAMDWLLKRQSRIEDKLASRHLKNNSLALYDLTSSYFEGQTCPLAALGHDRDGNLSHQSRSNRGGILSVTN